MAVSLNGQIMPSPMNIEGVLEFPAGEILDYDGYDQPIFSVSRIARWTWKRLSDNEMDYLTQTVLGDNYYVRGTVILYDPLDQRLEHTFTNAVIVIPTYDAYSGGEYQNVVLEIRSLINP